MFHLLLDTNNVIKAVYQGLTGKEVELIAGDRKVITVEILPGHGVVDAIFTGGEQNAKGQYRTITFSPKPAVEAHETCYIRQGKWVKRQNVGALWNMIRRERDEVLKNSDWTQLPDSPLTEQQKKKWQKRRQELRDLTVDYPEPDQARARLDELKKTPK